MNLRDQDKTRQGDLLMADVSVHLKVCFLFFYFEQTSSHCLFQSPMSDCYPSVTRLLLHLGNRQTVFYVDKEGLRRQFETGRAN
ncbi:hypothetical protein MJO28_015377 [Puccinia striiformis f. sp. tritici]|uniref:Uncharacterized protein n=2 Tax=Puccinia striiformis f. sp. tritici TaxID=168172 RepID=A0ACC0DSK7_9BASI|nr:hypothetical protein MJO28_015356 [Puccinia striiformis f. sp. tritici]KAI7938457.1 hypothetical protein MJO28_015377 [Puccinia striiformis f. sp. tritici]